MSNFAALQTANNFSAVADDSAPNRIFGAATDGNPAGLALAVSAPQGQCATSVATLVAADTATCDFTQWTAAGLNLAAGESRIIRAKYRTSGPLASAVTHGYTDFGVINVAGTLTATTLTAIVYGATGMVANTVVWSVTAGVPRCVITLGAGVTACRVVLDASLDIKGS